VALRRPSRETARDWARTPWPRFLKHAAFGLLAGLLLGGLPLLGADRCADARDDIRRARAIAENGEEDRARKLLRSALLACPMNAQNLELLAEVFDDLGDFAQAGKYRQQAMRVKGISSKPVVDFAATSPSIERGQTVDLTWTTQYATEVEISPEFGRVAARGRKTVAPAATSTYQLTAKGPGGSATTSVEIKVTIPRLTEANLVDLLENEVPRARIAKLVTERGVAFELTAEIEQRLRAAGADDTVIEAIKKTAEPKADAVSPSGTP